jgi:hypothetical protein
MVFGMLRARAYVSTLLQCMNRSVSFLVLDICKSSYSTHTGIDNGDWMGIPVHLRKLTGQFKWWKYVLFLWKKMVIFSNCLTYIHFRCYYTLYFLILHFLKLILSILLPSHCKFMTIVTSSHVSFECETREMKNEGTSMKVRIQNVISSNKALTV